MSMMITRRGSTGHQGMSGPQPSEALRRPRYPGECVHLKRTSLNLDSSSLSHAIISTCSMSAGSPPSRGIPATASNADAHASATPPSRRYGDVSNGPVPVKTRASGGGYALNFFHQRQYDMKVLAETCSTCVRAVVPTTRNPRDCWRRTTALWRCDCPVLL
jgi:hypothetical protein